MKPVESTTTVFTLRQTPHGMWSWLDGENYPHAIVTQFNTEEDALRWAKKNYPQGKLHSIEIPNTP